MSKAKPKLIIKLQQLQNLQILTLKLASICCLQNQKFTTFATSKAEGGQKNIEPQMDSSKANFQRELIVQVELQIWQAEMAESVCMWFCPWCSSITLSSLWF
jgi:hypothetical protein